MARQTGDILVRGTVDGLTFYRMEGKYYVRRKSSLTGRRFFIDKAFEGSRKSSSRFALGNRLASKLYRMVEEEKRVYALFCFLKKKAIALLKKGNSMVKVEKVLIEYLLDFGVLKEKEVKTLMYVIDDKVNEFLFAFDGDIIEMKDGFP